MNTPRLWGIIGATGTGKSALALDLADALGSRGRRAEIVNSDAMQLYRGMDIGTAKLPLSERRGIPHHLLDVCDPQDEATVAWYQREARGRIAEIMGRGADAILVGGSGLYVSSVVFDFQFPPRNHELRAELEAQCAEQSVDVLLARLRALDPQLAEEVDAKNPRRVVRALEVAILGGDARATLPSEQVLWKGDTSLIGIVAERAELVQRLDGRVELMWAQGLLDEVRALIPCGIERGPTASRAIGYAQALAQLAGDMSEEEAIAQTQFLTRRYARRQVSWFKRYANVEWLAEPSITGLRIP